ncbi:MAG: pitrilysin family protein, partial [Acidobacteriota bacterium]
MTERLAIRTRRVPDVPIVAARAWIRGGARVETVPGTSFITGRALEEGTGRHDWQSLADFVESRGINLITAGSYESLGIAIDAMAGLWTEVIDLLAELVFDATFPADRIDWLTRQAAAELEAMDDQPEAKTVRVFLDQLYHPHPYARVLQGDLDSLARIDRDLCRHHLDSALDHGVLVVVVGDIDEELVRQRLDGAFDRLRGPATPLPSVPPPGASLEPRRFVEVGNGDQAHLFLGQRTIPRTHPDRFALAALAVILGAGAGVAGRLPTRIREREGLAYTVDVSTAAGAGHDPGRFSVYLGTAPKNLDHAERAVRDELDRVLQHGVTDAELD